MTNLSSTLDRLLNANMLIRKFGCCTYDVKIMLYKSFCSNMYCCQFWTNASVSSFKRLKVSYNNGLRKFLGLPSFNSASEMFVCLNIPSFGELYRKNTYSLRERILNSNNSLLSVFNYLSAVQRHWDSILF